MSWLTMPTAAGMIQASLQASLLVLLVLVLRRFLGDRLAPRWRVALWLVVFARLALVVAPPTPWSLFNAFDVQSVGTEVVEFTRGAAFVSRFGESFAPAEGQLGETAPGRQVGAAAVSPSLGAGGFVEPEPEPVEQAVSPWVGLWAFGALVLCLAVAFGHVRLSRKLARARQCVDPEVLAALSECRAALGVAKPISVFEDEGAGSPLLIGAIRPMLLLPPGLAERLGPKGLRAVLMHEVAHVARHDIAIGWATTALWIVHWFNPLAWVAAARLRADREMACDALALAHMGRGASSSYGGALLDLLNHTQPRRVLPGLAAILEDKKDMQRRIHMIANFRTPGAATTLGGAALIAALAVFGLTNGMPAPPAPEQQVVSVEGAAIPEDLTAQEVLLRMARTYRAANSYQDEGVVVQRMFNADGTPRRRTDSVKPFSTAWTRAGELHDRFLFEYRQALGRSEQQYVVWSGGKLVRSWWSVRDEVTEHANLQQALVGPSSISGGSATVVPSLLLSGVSTHKLNLHEPTVDGVDEVDGRLCLRISGLTTVDHRRADQQPVYPTTLWVDAESFLLRRLVSRSYVDPARLREEVPQAFEDPRTGRPGPPFETETTITLTPILDEAIPQARFEFEPPH